MPEVNDIVDALIGCQSIKDNAVRNDIVNTLPEDIATSISRRPQMRADVVNIVKTCLQYTDGLDQLIDILATYEGESKSIETVLKFRTYNKTSHSNKRQKPLNNISEIETHPVDIHQVSGSKPAITTTVFALIALLLYWTFWVWITFFIENSLVASVAIGLIGVLCTVACGLYLFKRSIILPQTRSHKTREDQQSSEETNQVSRSPKPQVFYKRVQALFENKAFSRHRLTGYLEEGGYWVGTREDELSKKQVIIKCDDSGESISASAIADFLVHLNRHKVKFTAETLVFYGNLTGSE